MELVAPRMGYRHTGTPDEVYERNVEGEVCAHFAGLRGLIRDPAKIREVWLEHTGALRLVPAVSGLEYHASGDYKRQVLAALDLAPGKPCTDGPAELLFRREGSA
jgi:hypothetical protein